MTSPLSIFFDTQLHATSFLKQTLQMFFNLIFIVLALTQVSTMTTEQSEWKLLYRILGKMKPTPDDLNQAKLLIESLPTDQLNHKK